ncbi:hypothetical protein COV24_03470 [candidate division WWE3 bacterium CG10_big_fil_rev_8_21_14_0_10_32_10]|uniref:Uncharacterized protein n=1 Tax=candidate division WWE3 bacterium CG10_big_fil_rev_8_21_14_0_10_32_10 TaxID=1975090 RepID=A0A2H0R9T2_UNCKA|nr:MAG: hypothetical protein COV24_03470 [candidate division WWE3 bacterium CG10_big_fil_rev_8_21_14_0_10_32_10]
MDEKENFWESSEGSSKGMRLGSTMPPIKIYLSIIEIGKLNSRVPFVKTVFLADGKEVDIEFYLETDRDSFTRDLKEVIDDKD